MRSHQWYSNINNLNNLKSLDMFFHIHPMELKIKICLHEERKMIPDCSGPSDQMYSVGSRTGFDIIVCGLRGRMWRGCCWFDNRHENSSTRFTD